MNKLFYPLTYKLFDLIDRQGFYLLKKDNENYEQCRLDILETVDILQGITSKFDYSKIIEQYELF